MMRKVIVSVIGPRLEYGVLVWHDTHKKIRNLKESKEQTQKTVSILRAVIYEN